MDELMSVQIVETNRARRATFPSSAVSSKVWVIPPLGAAAAETAGNLQQAIAITLGGERTPLVAAAMGENSIGGLSQTLNLNALSDQQEIGVWITEKDGKSFANCSWAAEKTAGGYMGSTGAPLELAWFLPGATDSERFLARCGLDQIASLPGGVRGRIVSWIENEAVTRLQKEGSR
jgi:hypothetical protein